MMRRLITTLMLFSLALPCWGAKMPRAITHYRVVGAGLTYDTVTKAAAAAVAGDTILVLPGTYAEGVSVTIPANVNLIGTDKDNTTISYTGADAAAAGLLVLAGNNVVAHLKISNESSNAQPALGICDGATDANSVSRIHDCILYGAGDVVRPSVVGSWLIVDSCKVTALWDIFYSATSTSGPCRLIVQNCDITGTIGKAGQTSAAVFRVGASGSSSAKCYCASINNRITLSTDNMASLFYCAISIAGTSNQYFVSCRNTITLVSTFSTGDVRLCKVSGANAGARFFSFGDRVTLTPAGDGTAGCFNVGSSSKAFLLVCMGDATINNHWSLTGTDDSGSLLTAVRVYGKMGPAGVLERQYDDFVVPFVLYATADHATPTAEVSVTSKILSPWADLAEKTSRVTEVGDGLYLFQCRPADFSGPLRAPAVVELSGADVDTQYVPTSMGFIGEFQASMGGNTWMNW
jgi:hypothetical protein